MFGLFKPPQVISQNSAENIVNTFQWALESFDASTFIRDTQLVFPNNTFFPDRADNERDMAMAIYRRVLEYSGLSHWPFALVPPEHFQPNPPPLMQLDCSKRGGQALIPADAPAAPLMLTYSGAMMRKPMDLVASMSNLVAQHYLLQSQKTPPAGPQSFNETAEILSVFMGFGILVANSAYTFRGSCARCYDPRANRAAALSENEAIFSLALFCELKQVPAKKVLVAIKPYLRSTYKKSIKQIKSQPWLEDLQKKVV